MYIWVIATTNQFLMRVQKYQNIQIDADNAIIESSSLYKKDDFELLNVTVSNLLPKKQYTLKIDGNEYKYTTLGINRENFKFMAGSCSKYKSDSFLERPLDISFMVHNGDLFYADITVNNIDTYADQFRAKMTEEIGNGPNGKTIFEDTLVYYTPDDHDFANNNSNEQTPSHSAGTVSHRLFVPQLNNSFPLLNKTFEPPSIQNTVMDTKTLYTSTYKSFTNNNIRFVILDLRTQQNSQRMMDIWQKEQIELEMIDSYKYDVLFVFSSVSFNGKQSSTSEPDKWMAHEDERNWFSQLISKHNVKNLAMVAGDAHMLAFDDGTNTDFGGGGFPLFQCAPLSNYGSCKGGPYSTNPFAFRYYVNHFYCLFEINFTNEKVCLKWKGMQAKTAQPIYEKEICRGINDSWIIKGDQATSEYDCYIPLFPDWVIVLISFGCLFIAIAIGLAIFKALQWRKHRINRTISTFPVINDIELKATSVSDMDINGSLTKRNVASN